jgi:hypothetical protein
VHGRPDKHTLPFSNSQAGQIRTERVQMSEFETKPRLGGGAVESAEHEHP